MDPTFAPESADIRVADVNGDWHLFETTTYNHLEDGDVRGVLCTCQRVHDRSDLARAIEMLGSGAEVDEVIPIVARLADHSLGGAEVRTAIAWKQDERVNIVTRPARSPLDPRLADVARVGVVARPDVADGRHRSRRPDARRRRRSRCGSRLPGRVHRAHRGTDGPGDPRCDGRLERVDRRLPGADAIADPRRPAAGGAGDRRPSHQAQAAVGCGARPAHRVGQSRRVRSPPRRTGRTATSCFSTSISTTSSRSTTPTAIPSATSCSKRSAGASPA